MWEKIKALKGETKAMIVMAVLMLSAMIYGYYHENTKLPTKTPVVLPTTHAAESVAKDVVTVPLKVYRKPDIGKKVKLPEGVLDDPHKQIPAVSDVPPSTGGTEVVAIVDTITGDVTLNARAKELPLLGFENQKRIGVGYGIGTEGTEAKVFCSWTYARVGKVYLSAEGEINARTAKTPEAKAMATLDYRF